MTTNSKETHMGDMEFERDLMERDGLQNRTPVPSSDKKVAYEEELVNGYTNWTCSPLLNDGWFITYHSPHWLICDEVGHAVTSVEGTPDYTELLFSIGGTNYTATRVRIRPTSEQEDGWNAKYEKPINGIPGSDIALSAITSDLLADGVVTEDKIAEGAVTSGKISDGAVTTDKVEDLGITTAKLADGAVTGDKVGNGAVTTDKLANDAVTPDKLVKFTKWEFVPPRFNNNPIKMRELTENGWQPYTDGDGDIGAPQGDASSARLKWNLDTFSFAAIRFKVIPNKTSDLLNTGADGEHPFITIDEAMASAGVTLSANPDPGEYEAVYTISQGGVVIGNINIPKDFFVRNAVLQTCREPDVPVSGYVVGTKYVDFTINCDGDSETARHIYLDVSSLADEYFAQPDAAQIQLAINNNVISGAIVTGSVGTVELTDGAVTTEKIGDTAVTSKKIAKYTDWETTPDTYDGEPIEMVSDNGGWYPYTAKDARLGATKGDGDSLSLSWDVSEPALLSLTAVRRKMFPTKTSDLENDSGFLSGFMTPVTWQELKDLKEGLQLVPGMQYRIADYVATTNGDMSSRSANHPFDIIVTADSVSALNENARAIQSGSDSLNYFGQSNLAAWRLRYCLDNDASRFAWVDTTNGKGVVYYLMDEFNNECPYDFKGIQFKAYGDTDDVWRYTFDSGDAVNNMDNSLRGAGSNNAKSVYGNKILSHNDSHVGMRLNCIVFKGDHCYLNTFGYGSYSNTFGPYCNCNTFGRGFITNTFGYGCSFNKFDGNCTSNKFGNSCSYNKFGFYCISNEFEDECNSNTFGYDCEENMFETRCSDNKFGNHCKSNRFGDWCGNNTFENHCADISFGSNFQFNRFGSKCNNIQFKDEHDNQVNNVRYVIFENGNQKIVMKLTGSITQENPYRNVIVRSGINNSNNEITIVDNHDGGQTFNTIHKPRNSYEISW